MLCLTQAIQLDLFTVEDFTSSWEEIFPPMKTCLDEDWDADVRFYTCNAFCVLI